MTKRTFLLLSMSLLLVSCNMAKKPQETEPPTQQLTNVPTEVTNAPTEATNSPTQESAVGTETAALILDNYDDFLLYREGKLNVDASYYSWFGTDPKVFVDVRDLLKLPQLSEQGRRGQIIIENDSEFMYNIYSVDEEGRWLEGYTVIVSYDPNGRSIGSRLEGEKTFDSIKDVPEGTNVFFVRKENCYLHCIRNDKEYTVVQVSFENYSIQFQFNATGWTPAQIEEKCGKLVASLVSENDEELSRGVKTIATALGQES